MTPQLPTVMLNIFRLQFTMTDALCFSGDAMQPLAQDF